MTRITDFSANLENVALLIALIVWGRGFYAGIQISHTQESHLERNLQYNALYLKTKGLIESQDSGAQSSFEEFSAKSDEIDAGIEQWEEFESRQLKCILWGAVLFFIWYVVKGMPFEWLSMDLWETFKVAQPSTGEDLPHLRDPQPLRP
ncbi:hypothetical protein [Tritonibacter sp. SIMBA_163]|uniref:hypothetical protein n=1 Tax=Tritonibacter sp. SIMBA_163 TaxID=3080868 RepID=UPI00397EF4D8